MKALETESVSLQRRAMECLRQMQQLKLCEVCFLLFFQFILCEAGVVSKLQRPGEPFLETVLTRLCHSESGGVSEKAEKMD